jgi:hypothetical protein
MGDFSHEARSTGMGRSGMGRSGCLLYEPFANRGGDLQSGRFAFASGVLARTIDVRPLFHSLALGAAIFTGGYDAGTNRMLTLMTLFSRHYFSPRFRSGASGPQRHGDQKVQLALRANR